MAAEVSTPQRVVDDVRLLLRTVRDEAAAGRRPHATDVRRLVERALDLRFAAYVQFLERYGYLTLDRRSDLLSMTKAGEALLAGHEQTMTGLGEDARFHFGDQLKDDAPARRSSTGVRLDTRYLQLESIGRGGLGTVWQGRLLSVDRPVAIKMLDALDDVFRPDQRDAVVRRFEQCVRDHARLISPYIIQILDQNPRHQPPYFVMELAPGGNLRGLLAQGPMPPAVALKYVIQIALGLRAAHAEGVLHRDLKPENVLLDAVGNARLSDFGLTRVAERDGTTMRRAYVGYGSLGYMAPELIRGRGEPTPAADVYALGILLYEMLVGDVPGRRSPLPSDVVEGLPEAVDDLFDRMARDHLGSRMATVDEVLETIFGSDEILALLDVKGAPAFREAPIPLPGLPEGEMPEPPDGGGDGGGMPPSGRRPDPSGPPPDSGPTLTPRDARASAVSSAPAPVSDPTLAERPSSMPTAAESAAAPSDPPTAAEPDSVDDAGPAEVVAPEPETSVALDRPMLDDDPAFDDDPLDDFLDEPTSALKLSELVPHDAGHPPEAEASAAPAGIDLYDSTDVPSLADIGETRGEETSTIDREVESTPAPAPISAVPATSDSAPARPAITPRASVSMTPRAHAPRPRASISRSSPVGSGVRDRASRSRIEPKRFEREPEPEPEPIDLNRTAALSPIDLEPLEADDLESVGGSGVARGFDELDAVELVSIDEAEALGSADFEPLDVAPAAFDALPAADVKPIPQVISAVPVSAPEDATYKVSMKTSALSLDEIEIVDEPGEEERFRTVVHGRKGGRTDDKMRDLEARLARIRDGK